MKDKVDLDSWFSPRRMKRYNQQPHSVDLYVWNTRLSKAFLEDLEHIEVLLRNTINESLCPRYGDDWWSNGSLSLNDGTKRAVRKALKRGRKLGSTNIIPLVSFEFWRFLLVKYYQATVWPLVRKNLAVQKLPLSDDTYIRVFLDRKMFEEKVDSLLKLRNRCAHHEPLVKENLEEEYKGINNHCQTIKSVSYLLNPAAAIWISQHSRVPEILAQRPDTPPETYADLIQGYSSVSTYYCLAQDLMDNAPFSGNIVFKGR